MRFLVSNFNETQDLPALESPSIPEQPNPGINKEKNSIMLKAIFYARFHPERGPDVLHQFPAGSVSRSSAASSSTTNIDAAAAPPQSSCKTTDQVPFSDISAYLIPPHELSNRPLAICVQGYRVLGFPISIEGDGYERNRFVCNVCFAVDEEEEEVEEVERWEGLVRKTAAFFRGLEVEGEGGVLWEQEKVVDRAVAEGKEEERDGLIGWVLRRVFEQLNAFGECCVAVSPTQILNLKLEKRRSVGGKTAGRIKAWDVPLLIRALPDPESWTWDLVLQRIRPFVDGINHVAKIARLADVDLKLVKEAVRELVLHGRAMVLDIFHFQAVYALTSDFALLPGTTEILDECREYVAVDPNDGMFASVLSKEAKEGTSKTPDRSTIIDLYSVLKPGLSVADFCLSQQDRLANVDVRRFITFGVIKGFLKRMHKYALALDLPEILRTEPLPTTGIVDLDKAWRKAALSSGWATPPTDGFAALQEKMESEEERTRKERRALVKYLDGKHCLDQVCVEMAMQEMKVLEKVRGGAFGEVVVFCR